MKGILFAPVFIIVLFIGIFIFPGKSSAWEMYSGRALVVYLRAVTPGNHLTVSENRSGNEHDFTIRFYGIGIPTDRQPFGAQAHQELLRLLTPGTKLYITTINEDPNGIISALVQLNDHSVNNRLVDEGLAWVDRSTCKAFFCRRWHIQESIAIKERRGIWALNMQSPPWQWGEE